MSGTRARPLVLHGSAVLSAALASLAWPPLDLSELAWLAYTPWLAVLAVSRPGPAEAALAGAVHLSAVHLFNCWWFALVLEAHADFSWPMAALGALLSTLIGPLPYGFVLGAVAGLLVRRRGVSGLFGLPFAWAAVDALRTLVPISGTWALPAYTQAARPEVLGIAEWVGGHGVTALVVMGNVAVVAAVAAVLDAVSGRGRASLFTAALALGLVALSLAHGFASARAHEPSAERLAAVRTLLHSETEDSAVLARVDSLAPKASERGDVVRVGLVQGSAPQEVLLRTEPEEDLERARRQLALSIRALAEDLDLLVWSESSHPETVARLPSLLRAVQRLLGRVAPGPEAVVGVVIESLTDSGDFGYTNSVLLVGEEGPRGRHDKRILVPFGEYVPAERAFFWVERLAGALGSRFLAGRSAEPLRSRSGALGASVCYEAGFPGEQRALVRAGAELLVNVTNDGWFHGSPAPEQHLRFSVLRAVENRRWVVRCANSGVSAVVAPNGRVVARMAEGERGVLIAEAERRRGLSPYARVGDLPLFAAGLLTLAWALKGKGVKNLFRRAGRGS